MLLKDFLNETAVLSRMIMLLASAVLKTYLKNPRRAISVADIAMSFAEPALQELAKTLVIKFDSKYDRSMYNPKTKEVLIRLTDNLLQLKSELIHELQHAVDDFKSKGKFRNEKGTYQTRQSEVNARLAQALYDIEEALKKVKLKNIDWNRPSIRKNVLNLINAYLKKHNLTKDIGLDNKRYQKIVKRIYNYITTR